MRTTVWFIRSGQSVFNQQRRYHGQSESELTVLGIAQIQQAVVQVRRQHLTALYCAPQRVAMQSASFFCTAQHITPQPDAAWADQALGQLSGLTRAEARVQQPELYALRMRDPVRGRAAGTESIADVAQRCVQGWTRLLALHRGQRIAVVTHALPIQMVLCAVLGTPLPTSWMWRIDNGSTTCLDVYANTVIVRCINQTAPVTREHIDSAVRAHGQTPTEKPQ